MRKGINTIILLLACVLLLEGTTANANINNPVSKNIVSVKVAKEKLKAAPKSITKVKPKSITKTITKVIPKNIPKTITKVIPKSVNEEKPLTAPKIVVKKENIKPAVVENKIVTIDNQNATTLKGIKYKLPDKVPVKMSNGEFMEQSVTWDNTEVNNMHAGVLSFTGSVKGYDKQVLLSLKVNEIIKIDDLSGIIGEDKNFKLPEQVTGEVSDDTKSIFEVTWDLTNIEKPEPGISVYYGTVTGYDNKIKYTLNRKIPEKVQEILNVLIKPGMVDFEKELAIHNYLIEKTIYSTEKSDFSVGEFSDYDVIVNGKGRDYTFAFNRLLNAAGIECKFITGEKNSNSNWNSSIWNLVKLDGNYYHVDILLDYIRFQNDYGAITYKYFNLSDSDIKIDHRWKENEYEPCVSEQYSINAMRNIELDTKAKQIISSIITPDMSDIQKEISVHNYIVLNTVYDKATLDTVLSKGIYIEDDTNSAYAALIKGKSMCIGYAEGIKKLLSLAGLESMVILGDVADSKELWMGHAWNLVKLDNEYYHLDATYDDPINANGDQVLRYSYFNLTDAVIAKDHKWNPSIYPIATGTKYNQTNLKLTEKDAKGKDIISISNINDLTTILMGVLNGHKGEMSIKILSYSDIFMDTMKNSFRYSNLTKYEGSYFDDNFGSRYYDIKFTY